MAATLLDVGSVDGWYLCGPLDMVETLQGTLAGLGVDASAINTELFFDQRIEKGVIEKVRHVIASPFERVTYSEANPHVNDSAWPERRLDHVLVSWPRQRPSGNPVAAERFGLDAVDGVTASDHWGVWADLRTGRELHDAERR